MDISIGVILFILFAALVAAIVRNRDMPVSTLGIKPFVITYAGSLIAAALVVWMLVDANGDTDNWDAVMTFANFAVVAGSAVGGIAFVQAILGYVPGTDAYKARTGKK